MLACPHCHQPFDNAPDLAGQLVECPHCRGQMQMPGTLTVQPVQSVPSIVVTHRHDFSSPKRKGRERSIESRVFIIAAGLTVLIGGTVFAVYVARVEYTKHAVKSAFQDIGSELRKEHEEGRPFVQKALKSHGLTLANNASIRRVGDAYEFKGSARNSRGVHEVRGRVKVAMFDGEHVIELEVLYVGNELVAGR